MILAEGEPVFDTEPLCGQDLERVVLIKHGRGSPVERVRVELACDVTTPLTGQAGAAAVFGPQKGATPAQVAWFDQQLQALADRTGKQREAATPGSGAAGGLAFGLLAFLPGTPLRPGVEIVFEALGLRERLRGVDRCITGEGRLDAGTFHGKAPAAVAALCHTLGVACEAVVGSADPAVGEQAANAFARVSTLQPASDFSLQATFSAEETRRRLITIGSQIAKNVQAIG